MNLLQEFGSQGKTGVLNSCFILRFGSNGNEKIRAAIENVKALEEHWKFDCLLLVMMI